MITWVTVWVLTILPVELTNGIPVSYQLTYSNQKQCMKQGELIKQKYNGYRYVAYYCNFQQVPIYIPKDNSNDHATT